MTPARVNLKFLFLLAAALPALSGCISARVTPATIAVVPGRGAEIASVLKRWDEAVTLCNAFLASPARQTLPAGRVEFGRDGMTFVTGDTRLPMRVRCTSFGDLLIPFKMAAQERSDGFVVGLVPPKENRILDNSFFKHANGEPASGAAMAGLILHELTHSYHGLGTVGFCEGLSYYAEAVFLFRYRTHSKEALPYRTSAEFRTFMNTRAPRRSNASVPLTFLSS